MQYEIELTYSEPLIRYAVLRFWWRVVGVRFLVALVLLIISLSALVRNGDTSWVVGSLGAVLTLAFTFIVALYFVHYRNSIRKFRVMGKPQATLVASEASLFISSGAGSTTLPWSSVAAVWQFTSCWLLLFSKAHFATLPLATIGPEARAFILERVRTAGGKID